MLVRALLLCLSIFLLSPKSMADLPDFTGIVDAASPAVVKILVEYESENPRYQEQMEELPEYLRRFFDFRGGPPVPRDRAGMGSGFIISEDGYVVTNNHVVENARQVVVRLPDRQEFDAEIIGTDPRSDLAVLKIDADRLPMLTLATDDDVKVGQWVLAIGSPFSLDFSVTAGIVSALGRSLPTQTGDNYVPFIQTDVAINPGNSGGPLFNMDGEVIGVNSQIFTRSGGSIGLSFAIPASVVSNVVPGFFLILEEPDGGVFVVSDGLATASVFVEPLPLGAPGGEGAVIQGATLTYTRGVPGTGGGLLISVLGEVPLVTARLLADAVRAPKGAE